MIIFEYFCITSGAAILQILLRSCHFRALLHNFCSSYPSHFAQQWSFWSIFASSLQQLSFRFCAELIHFGALLHHLCSSYPSEFAQSVIVFGTVRRHFERPSVRIGAPILQEWFIFVFVLVLFESIFSAHPYELLHFRGCFRNCFRGCFRNFLQPFSASIAGEWFIYTFALGAQPLLST